MKGRGFEREAILFWGDFEEQVVCCCTFKNWKVLLVVHGCKLDD